MRRKRVIEALSRALDESRSAYVRLSEEHQRLRAELDQAEAELRVQRGEVA
jgi:uncharacterized protein involved in exopolysaccharide biosynthesis